MGRKRAAFPEGIAEEEQRYAQVLREICDLRSETQQELGRLLSWSVSTVSRFEAATERPDRATHRRYCALAPTKGAARAGSGSLRALPAPPERHAAPVRMSPEEWHGRALDGPGLYQFFEAAYPGCPVVRQFGDEVKPLNQLTYDLATMARDDRGRLRLDCKLGTYFHSLSTSEAFDPELMEAYTAWPDSDPEKARPRLERRTWLHERVADPVANGRWRSAALGVSTLTIVRVRNRGTTS